MGNEQRNSQMFENRYEFGDVVVDSRRIEVRRAGVSIDLEPKAFDVLRYLIENRDRLVPKDELLDAVWKDTFVTSNALSRPSRSCGKPWVTMRPKRDTLKPSSNAATGSSHLSSYNQPPRQPPESRHPFQCPVGRVGPRRRANRCGSSFRPSPPRSPSQLPLSG